MERLEAAITALAEAQQRTEAAVAALTAAQQRTEQRVERLEAIVTALAEAQQRTEQRLERLEAIVTALAEAQQRTEQRLEQLAAQVEQLAAHQARLQITLDKHTGYFLEGHYRARPYAYLGRVLRRARTVTFEDLEEVLESQLSEDDMNELTLVDVIVRGRPKTMPDAEVWLAIEVSATVDRDDVERAQRRAAILRRAGYRAVPAVAGDAATRGGEESARAGNVVLLQDGRLQFWDEALTAAIAGAE